MKLYKFFIDLLILLIIVALAGVIFLINQGNISNSNSKSTELPPTSSQITVVGTQACLPHKDQTGPQTLECAIGLKTTHGYYGLKNIPQADLISNKLSTTKPFMVTGTLETGTDSKYDTLGTITVSSITY